MRSLLVVNNVKGSSGLLDPLSGRKFPYLQLLKIAYSASTQCISVPFRGEGAQGNFSLHMAWCHEQRWKDEGKKGTDGREWAESQGSRADWTLSDS